jgi:hypothetical protein
MIHNTIFDVRPDETIHRETESGLSLVFTGKMADLVKYLRDLRKKEAEKRLVEQYVINN